MISAFIVAVAIVLAYLAGGSIKTEVPPKFSDTAIEAVHPGANELDIRQTRIGIDLAPGHSFDHLEVDNVIIPDDQLTRTEPLSQYFYTPGPGTETGALSPGRHCASASFAPLNSASNRQLRTYEWCFNLH